MSKTNRLYLGNDIEIDGIKINEKIFQNELVDWQPEDRETFIDLLIDWISETTSENDKYLMKGDLIMMIEKGNDGDQQTFFKSIQTNEYLFSGDEGFDEVCDEILKLNGNDFLDDKEKMRDFKELSKEEFLKSYSYLTEEDYNLTKELLE